MIFLNQRFHFLLFLHNLVQCYFFLTLIFRQYAHTPRSEPEGKIALIRAFISSRNTPQIKQEPLV